MCWSSSVHSKQQVPNYYLLMLFSAFALWLILSNRDTHMTRGESFTLVELTPTLLIFEESPIVFSVQVYFIDLFASRLNLNNLYCYN